MHPNSWDISTPNTDYTIECFYQANNANDVLFEFKEMTYKLTGDTIDRRPKCPITYSRISPDFDPIVPLTPATIPGTF